MRLLVPVALPARTPSPPAPPEASAGGAGPVRARARALAVLALVALTGCAGSVQTVDVADAAPPALHALAERRVDVHLADGSVVPAHGLRVLPDTASWVDPETGALVAVPTAAVAEVRHRDRAGWSRRVAGRAALAAALGGAALGAAAGWDLAGFCFFACPEPSTSERVQAATAFAIGTAAVGALYGTTAGAVAGAVVAPQDRFVFPTPPGPSGRAGRLGEPAPPAEPRGGAGVAFRPR